MPAGPVASVPGRDPRDSQDSRWVLVRVYIRNKSASEGPRDRAGVDARPVRSPADFTVFIAGFVAPNDFASNLGNITLLPANTSVEELDPRRGPLIRPHVDRRSHAEHRVEGGRNRRCKRG